MCVLSVCVRNFLAKRKIMSASELDVLFPPTGKRACALDVAALEGLPRAAFVDAPRRAPIALPPAKTEPCVAFAHLGRCPFGSSCLHRHESIPARASRGAHSDSSATAQLRKAFADSLDEARSHAANGRHADALKHYGSAEFLAESILTVESGGDAAALARTALLLERTGVLVATGNLDEARHALEGALALALHAKSRELELAVRNRFVECLSQEPSAAAAVRDHLVRFNRLAEEASPATHALAGNSAAAILEDLLLGGVRTYGDAVHGEGGGVVDIGESGVAVRAGMRRLRWQPSPVFTRSRLHISSSVDALALPVDVSIPRAPLPVALARRVLTRVLFVCEAAPGALMCLPAAMLAGHHLQRLRKDGQDGCGGGGGVGEAVDIDWAVSDGRNLGPVRALHPACCEALEAHFGCNVGRFDELRCVTALDLRGDTLVVAMDAPSTHILTALEADMKATAGGSADAIAADDPSLMRAYLPPVSSTFDRRLPDGLTSELNGAIAAAVKASRRARRRKARGDDESAQAMAWQRELEAQRAMLALIEEGCRHWSRGEGWEESSHADPPAARDPHAEAPSRRVAAAAHTQALGDSASSDGRAKTVPDSGIDRRPGAVFDGGRPSAAICDLLEGLALRQHAQTFADHRIGIGDLPDLTDADMREMGLGIGARQRLKRYLDTTFRNVREDDAIARVLRRFGLQEASPCLRQSLREAGVDDARKLWMVTDEAMDGAGVPLAARRVVLRAGRRTKELGQMLSALGRPPNDLPRMLESGYESIDALLGASPEALRGVLPGAAVGRIEEWLHAYAHEAPRGPDGAPSTPHELMQRYNQAGGPRLTAAPPRLDGDMRVALERRVGGAVLRARLEAQLAVAGAALDARST